MEENRMNQETAKLYRSKSNRVIGGVCGGIAEYFNIDPILIRIAWVFISLFAGAGIIAYIIALIIIPDNPRQEATQSAGKSSGDAAKLWGSALIIIGGILLLKQMGVFYHFHWWSIPWQGFLAVILVGLGIYLIFNQKKQPDIEAEDTDEQHEGYTSRSGVNTIYRIHENKMLAGVCTGLAAYFDIDVTLIRLLWVFATLASGGLGILAYIIAIIIFPEAENPAAIKHNGGNQ